MARYIDMTGLGRRQPDQNQQAMQSLQMAADMYANQQSKANEDEMERLRRQQAFNQMFIPTTTQPMLPRRDIFNQQPMQFQPQPMQRQMLA